MKPLIPLTLCSMCLGCSDLGTGWDGEWVSYDLPHGSISLPASLIPARVIGAPPMNPEYAGVVTNQSISVQFCIYDSLWMHPAGRYQEQSVTLHGRPAVLFRGLGIFHVIDSHFSEIVGMKASFGPEGDPVVVMVELPGPEAEDLARSIVFTMRP